MIEALPEIVGEAVESVKSCKLVRCCAIAFGPSSIDCEIVYDDRTRDPDTLAKHKSEIIVGVKRAFEREGDRLRLSDRRRPSPPRPTATLSHALR